MLQDYLSEKHKKKKKKQQEIALVLLTLLIVLVVAGVWWVLFRSSLLRVDQVAVQGNSNVASSDIVGLLDGIVANEHGFARSVFGMKNMFAWPRTIASSSFSYDPRLESISLAKDYWTHTITATVTERQPFAIWCDMPKLNAEGNPDGNEACFWFDEQGTIFQTAFDTEGSALFAVHDYSQDSAALGGTILPQVFIPNMISILNVLRQSDLDIKEVALNDIGLQEIDVTTYEGPTIYFSLRFPADEYLPVLKNLMTQPTFDKLQYVDFRVLNRAYYQ